MNTGSQVLDPGFLAVELGFRILQSLGIPDSLGCMGIPNPRIPDSTSTNFADSTFSYTGDFPTSQSIKIRQRKLPYSQVNLSPFPLLFGYYVPTPKSPL